jgi:hypothetical protein
VKNSSMSPVRKAHTAKPIVAHTVATAAGHLLRFEGATASSMKRHDYARTAGEAPETEGSAAAVAAHTHNEAKAERPTCSIAVHSYMRHCFGAVTHSSNGRRGSMGEGGRWPGESLASRARSGSGIDVSGR